MRNIVIEDDWLIPLVEEALGIEKPCDEGLRVAAVGGRQVAMVRGSVEPHIDYDGPRWTYTLVLRCGRFAHYINEDGVGCVLEPGLIFEVDLHAMHGVQQKPKDVYIFASVDSSKRLSIEDAVERHRSAWISGERLIERMKMHEGFKEST